MIKVVLRICDIKGVKTPVCQLNGLNHYLPFPCLRSGGVPASLAYLRHLSAEVCPSLRYDDILGEPIHAVIIKGRNVWLNSDSSYRGPHGRMAKARAQ